jgi:splicing factor 3B subunit 5
MGAGGGRRRGWVCWAAKQTNKPGERGTTSSHTMADIFNVNQSLSRNWEFLRSRYVGTHDPDSTRWELVTQVKRDSSASAIAHLDLLAYMALAENQSPARTRYNLIAEAVRPCGPRPPPLKKIKVGGGNGAAAAGAGKER